MKTSVYSLLLLATVALWSGNQLHAKEPPSSPQKGKVLILQNENTIEGDIERVGESYRIRRALGEAWMPANRVLHLAASMPAAYLYLRDRINTEDADERLRLARWCRDHKLRDQAMIEIRAATALRPDHAPTQRLLERLQQEAVAANEPKPPAPLPPTPQDTLPPIEVTTESLSTFALRVQPILMNTCASCHATGHGGKFHLKQVYEDGLGNRRSLEQNLTAVLLQVNVNQPEASQLLSKAIIDHAHIGQAPLRDRRAAPYRTMENWIKTTLANNPHLRDVLPSSPVTPVSAVPPQAVGRRSNSEESEFGAATHPPEPAKSAAKVSQPAAPAGQPASKTANPPPNAPPDPYDPEPFNQRMHPQANKPGPGK